MAVLLRASGLPLRYLPPATRATFTKAIWTLADTRELKLFHYNILLKVFISLLGIAIFYSRLITIAPIRNEEKT